MRPLKVLNLYAGIGGNRKKWTNVEVTAIEYDPKIANLYKELNPEDSVIITDAHDFLLNNHQDFDVVWSSPPCQSHTKMIRSGRNRKPIYPDMKLYEEILFLKYDFKGKFVVENVKPYYEPFLNPTKIGRHLFWSNFDIPAMDNVPHFKNMMNRQNVKEKQLLHEWLGIFYEGNVYYKGNHCPTQILRNCVHPDLGLHVFKQILNEPS